MEFDTKVLDGLYKLSEVKKGDKRCAYCGARETDREHVMPRSFFHDDRRPHFRFHMHINNLVWSCRECNMLAGSTPFKNFWEKKVYICVRVRMRYKKLLSAKPWSAKEIRDLRGKVKAHVYSKERFKEQLLARLENLEKPEICGVIDRGLED